MKQIRAQAQARAEAKAQAEAVTSSSEESIGSLPRDEDIYDQPSLWKACVDSGFCPFTDRPFDSEPSSHPAGLPDGESPSPEG